MESNKQYGILCAVPEEFAALCAMLTDSSTRIYHGSLIATGLLNEANVIIACAGIGNINSAITTTMVISDFDPDMMLFCGIAGALNPQLSIGDIIICSQTFQAEAITHEQLNALWEMPRLLVNTDQNLLNSILPVLSQPHPYQVKNGVIVSSDLFPAPPEFNKLFSDNHAEAIDMETTAFYKACIKFKKPCLAIRSISNAVNSHEHEEIHGNAIQIAANSASAICFKIIASGALICEVGATI